MAKAILDAQKEGNGVYMVIMLKKHTLPTERPLYIDTIILPAIWLPMSFVTHG